MSQAEFPHITSGEVNRILKSHAATEIVSKLTGYHILARTRTSRNKLIGQASKEYQAVVDGKLKHFPDVNKDVLFALAKPEVSSDFFPGEIIVLSRQFDTLPPDHSGKLKLLFYDVKKPERDLFGAAQTTHNVTIAGQQIAWAPIYLPRKD